MSSRNWTFVWGIIAGIILWYLWRMFQARRAA